MTKKKTSKSVSKCRNNSSISKAVDNFLKQMGKQMDLMNKGENETKVKKQDKAIDKSLARLGRSVRQKN